MISSKDIFFIRSEEAIGNFKFNLIHLHRKTNDSVAQLVEQLTLNQWVQGSIPCGVTSNKKVYRNVSLFIWMLLNYWLNEFCF